MIWYGLGYNLGRVLWVCFVVALAIWLNVLLASCGPTKIPIGDLSITCDQLKQQSQPIIDDVTKHDASVEGVPTDAQGMLDFCTNDLKARGYTFLQKPAIANTKIDRYTTTLGKMVWLGDGFKQKPIPNQALTMCHERVHALTEDRYGLQKSKNTYITAAGRIGMEVPAYRMQYFLAGSLGFDGDYLERMRERVVRSLRRDYFVNVSYECLDGIVWGSQ